MTTARSRGARLLAVPLLARALVLPAAGPVSAADPVVLHAVPERIQATRRRARCALTASGNSTG